MIDRKRNNDELREVCPIFLDLQGWYPHMNPSPQAESRGPGEAPYSLIVLIVFASHSVVFT